MSTTLLPTLELSVGVKCEFLTHVAKFVREWNLQAGLAACVNPVLKHFQNNTLSCADSVNSLKSDPAQTAS